MKQGRINAMKRYIKASKSYDNIPTIQEYLEEVDDQDRDIIDRLMNIKTFNGKLIRVPSARNKLGRTDGYGKEDKVIHLEDRGNGYRRYSIPYSDWKFPGVIGVFLYYLTCYDDGTFQFGDGKIRSFDSVSDNTLSNDVYKAMRY